MNFFQRACKSRQKAAVRRLVPGLLPGGIAQRIADSLCASIPQLYCRLDLFLSLSRRSFRRFLYRRQTRGFARLSTLCRSRDFLPAGCRRGARISACMSLRLSRA